MKILVVDDESIIVESLVEIIRSYGDFEVNGALSGQDALTTAGQMGGVDLLITDVVMDRMDGFALTNTLKPHFPGMHVVYVTGYDLSDYAQNVAGATILPKPIHSRAILQEVHRIWEIISEAERQRALQAPVVEAILLAEPLAAPVAEEPALPTDQPVPAATVEPVAVEVVAPVAPPVAVPAVVPVEVVAPVEQVGKGVDVRNLVKKQGFTGQLDQFQLVDIIQMCCMSRRTGRLKVSHAMERGVIYLKDGNMVHAVVGTEVGDAGVYRIISWDVGQFTFEYGVEAPEKSIHVGWEHIVMEGVRLCDESKAGEASAGEAGRSLVGETLSGYEIIKRLGAGQWGDSYEAMQLSVHRPVTMKVLRPELAAKPELVQEFLADASVKANVQHPAIVAVYEAGQDGDRYFYTREHIEGSTLSDFHAHGTVLDEHTALQIIRTAADALSYFNQSKIPHTLISSKDVFLDAEKRPRVANLADLRGEHTIGVQKEIHALSKIVNEILQDGMSASPGMRALLARMALEGDAGYVSFGALIHEVKNFEPVLPAADTFKISARDQAAIQAVSASRQRHQRKTLLTIGGIGALLGLIGFVLWFTMFRGGALVENKLVRIEGGDFIFQNGVKKTLPPFWIDQYEVTIAQYAEFLEDLKEKPTTKFDAPNQPVGKSHVPQDWDRYYAAAKAGKAYDMAPITLNCPVILVDWYDAYAYAKWKGCRLPTEQEWEKAARGTTGKIYPWGNTFDATKLNSSADYNSNPAVAGDKDGFNRFAPVDSHPGDVSEFGVRNMGGNVSEWTSTMTRSSGLEVPVIRGGCFNLPGYELTIIRTKLLAEQAAVSVGFRTVSDKPPGE